MTNTVSPPTARVSHERAKTYAREGTQNYRILLWIVLILVLTFSGMMAMTPGRLVEALLSALSCAGFGVLVAVLPLWLALRAAERRVTTFLTEGAVIVGQSDADANLATGVHRMSTATVRFTNLQGQPRRAVVAVAGWAAPHGLVSVIVHPRWPDRAYVTTGLDHQSLVECRVRNA